MSETMMNGIAPLFIDLVSCYQQKKGTTDQDFDKSLGSVDMEPSMELCSLIMTYILHHYKNIFLEGQDVMMAFMNHIKVNGNWIVDKLSDEQIVLFDPEFGSLRRLHGSYSYAHVFLVQNECIKTTIILYST